MIWAIAATVAGLAALVWVLAFAPTWPRHTTPAGRHRAHDATDPDIQHWRAFTDTVPNIRLAAIAESAAQAIAEIPAPEGDPRS